MANDHPTRRRFSAALLALATPAFAAAQSFPGKPVRLLVGSAPGSVIDVFARQLAAALGAQTGHRVYVDAKPSAGGILALETLKNSLADGHTIALVAMPQISVSPSLFASLPYDPVKDFAPVGILFRGPQVLVASAGVPAKSVKELIALSRARPEGVRFSSPAVGSPSHIFMEQLRIETGGNLQHVAYKGPAANAAVAVGEVDALLEGATVMQPLIEAGKVRPLAVSGRQRIPSLADVPTFDELGIPNIDAVWVGIVAPARTPVAIIEVLNQQFARAMRTAEVRRHSEAAGRHVEMGTPQEMAAVIEGESGRWRETFRRAGIAAN